MPELFLNSCRMDLASWNPGCIWCSWDYVERAISLCLALMFGCTIVVAVRFSRCYYLTRREVRSLKQDDFLGVRRATLNFVVEMCPAIAMLRGIASAAPFLGLAGTCYGFLADFDGLRASAVGRVVTPFADVPIWTAAGILVAVPAAVLYNSLRTRIEAFRSQFPSSRVGNNGLGSLQAAQSLPLKARFSCIPAYAVMAAPLMACVVVAYLVITPYPDSKGLRVNLGTSICQYDRRILLQIDADGVPSINMERTDWKMLPTQLSAIYASSEIQELYLYADESLPFQTVADAIDIARKPAVGRNSYKIRVILITPAAARKCGIVPIRVKR